MPAMKPRWLHCAHRCNVCWLHNGHMGYAGNGRVAVSEVSIGGVVIFLLTVSALFSLAF